MLIHITHETKGEHRRLQVAGVAIIAMAALLIALSVAIYQKKFDRVTWVTIKSENAGLQLSRFGDVRQHGVLVGQVRSIVQDGEQASIKVALQPDAAKKISSNVSVEILPTTLFGQKFISFVDPEQPSGKALSDGSVIPSDRVRTNAELQAVLADLFPLLRSIRPEDLNTTLYSISNALEGRGDKLGQTIETLDSYLINMNQHLPTLKEDLTLFAKVAKSYSMAAPDIVKVLKNATVTANTVNRQQQQLGVLFTSMTRMSNVSSHLLETNEQAVTREMRLASPLAKLLDTYSPEYVCLLQALSLQSDNLNDIFKGNAVRQFMDLDAKQRKGYTQAERPTNGEAGANEPRCMGLPNAPVPFKGGSIRNGYPPAANPEGVRP